MNLETVLSILAIVRADLSGATRDLSYTPSKKEIIKAIEIVSMGAMKNNIKRNFQR